MKDRYEARGGDACPKTAPSTRPCLGEGKAQNFVWLTFFFIAEEEKSCREGESPGLGGFPAYDFYPLLSALLLSPLHDCEPNAESIWRELVRNPSFALLCGFDAGEVPSPRTLRRFRTKPEKN